MTWLSLQISSSCRDRLRLSPLISSLPFPFKSAEANPYIPANPSSTTVEPWMQTHPKGLFELGSGLEEVFELI